MESVTCARSGTHERHRCGVGVRACRSGRSRRPDHDDNHGYDRTDVDALLDDGGHDDDGAGNDDDGRDDDAAADDHDDGRHPIDTCRDLDCPAGDSDNASLRRRLHGERCGARRAAPATATARPGCRR